VSPMKKRRQGIKSCSSINESVSASSVQHNPLVRSVCLQADIFHFVYKFESWQNAGSVMFHVSACGVSAISGVCI